MGGGHHPHGGGGSGSGAGRKHRRHPHVSIAIKHGKGTALPIGLPVHGPDPTIRSDDDEEEDDGGDGGFRLEGAGEEAAHSHGLPLEEDDGVAVSLPLSTDAPPSPRPQTNERTLTLDGLVGVRSERSIDSAGP